MANLWLMPPFVVVSVAACGGRIPTDAEPSDAATTDATARDSTTTPSVCRWSPSLEPLDAMPMRDSCRAARTLMRCTGSDGTEALCITDQAKCELPTLPGVSFTCKNECTSTQFAATCGTIMGSSVVPPADCPLKMATPGGILYCCACGM